LSLRDRADNEPDKEKATPLSEVAFALEELPYFLSSFVTSTPGGRITASIAWMTPFDAITSAATTFAPCWSFCSLSFIS
jgi:hypothetical protein